MNTNSLLNSIQAKNEIKKFSYAADLIKSFVIAYLKHPGLQKKYQQFKLFNHYYFRSDLLFERAEKYQYDKGQLIKEFLNSSNIFVGFRYYDKHFTPFFISMNMLSKGEFDICGFSTYLESDWRTDYFNPKTTINLSELKITSKLVKNFKLAEIDHILPESSIFEILKIAKKSAYFKSTMLD